METEPWYKNCIRCKNLMFGICVADVTIKQFAENGSICPLWEEKTMEIKPCPFCRSNKVYISDSYHCVCCSECEAVGPRGKTDERGVELWNAAPRKEDAEMEKSCRNCKYLKLGYQNKNKWYCAKTLTLEDEYSCKSWAPYNPFGDAHATVCDNCQYGYWDDDEYYCGKAIGNLDYCCPGWEEKGSESTPLTPSDSNSLDELCRASVEKWGATTQIYKAIEELSELITALARYQNADENSDDAILSAADNIREEREDVGIMLRQLDVIFGRSEEWQHKKHEHLRCIVGGDTN